MLASPQWSCQAGGLLGNRGGWENRGEKCRQSRGIPVISSGFLQFRTVRQRPLTAHGATVQSVLYTARKGDNLVFATERLADRANCPSCREDSHSRL